MSTIDPLAALLAELDRAATPRREFAEKLLARLLADVQGPAPLAASERRSWLERLSPRTPVGVRLALILIALLLLLAGFATATYLGVREWVTAGPRSAQHLSNYRLSTAFATTGNPVGWSPGGSRVGWWTSLALEPGGHALYAMTLPPNARVPEIIRVEAVDRGTRLRAKSVFALANLNLRGWCVWPFVRPLSVAANGDVFFVAGGLDLPSAASTRKNCAPSHAMNDGQAFSNAAASGLGYSLTPSDSAAHGGRGHLLLFIRHPNGSQQLILAGSELVRSKLFPPDWMEWQMVASAPDRVWLWVDPAGSPGPPRLIEVLDPNSDGDWSDRLIRPLALPLSLALDSFPEARWQLASEPSLPGENRARSILIGTSDLRSGEFRVYRIDDLNGDGDALDRAEVRVLLARHGAASAQIATRIVVRSGVARRELVVTGLSRPDRVSLISESGVVTDVARAFQGLSTVLAGPNGMLYPITGGWGLSQPNNRMVVYRLEPVTAGTGAISVGAPARQAAPTVSFAPPLPGGAPRLEFRVTDGAGSNPSSYTIGADGSNRRKLVPHAGPGPICQSVDGRELAYTSDAEVPTEFFTYVARDGSQPTKVTERNDRIVCPFTRQWLLLYRASRYRPDGSSIGSLIRHDLRGGHEIVVVRDVDNRYALSPDATKLVYVNRGQEALRLLDLDTLQRRTLAGPETDVLYSHGGPGEGESGLRWAPDGRRIGYFTGFRPRGASWNSRLHRYEHAFRVVDIDTGSTVTRLRIAGGPPSVAWSPDSTRLLICARDRAHESNCGAGPGRLLLVDLRAGSVQTVARGPLNLVGWSPSGTTFAYATPRALFLVTAAGTRRLPTMKPLGPCGVECPWLGWSPNGRYIGFDAGLTEKPPGGIQLIDVRTGRLRVLRPVGPGYYLGISWLTR